MIHLPANEIKKKFENKTESELEDYITKTSIEYINLHESTDFSYNRKGTLKILDLVNLFYCFKAFAPNVKNNSNLGTYIKDFFESKNNTYKIDRLDIIYDKDAGIKYIMPLEDSFIKVNLINLNIENFDPLLLLEHNPDLLNSLKEKLEAFNKDKNLSKKELFLKYADKGQKKDEKNFPQDLNEDDLKVLFSEIKKSSIPLSYIFSIYRFEKLFLNKEVLRNFIYSESFLFNLFSGKLYSLLTGEDRGKTFYQNMIDCNNLTAREQIVKIVASTINESCTNHIEGYYWSILDCINFNKLELVDLYLKCDDNTSNKEWIKNKLIEIDFNFDNLLFA